MDKICNIDVVLDYIKMETNGFSWKISPAQNLYIEKLLEIL